MLQLEQAPITAVSLLFWHKRFHLSNWFYSAGSSRRDKFIEQLTFLICKRIYLVHGCTTRFETPSFLTGFKVRSQKVNSNLRIF